MRTRFIHTCLVAAIAVLGAAPAASAATADFSVDTLTITGTAVDETFAVTQVGNLITVTGPGFAEDPDDGGALCENPSPATVTCVEAETDSVVVNAGGGVDQLTDARESTDDDDADTLNGEAGNDVITCLCGSGTDQDVFLDGGADNDTLTKNAASAQLTGGPGNDTLNAGTSELEFSDTGGEGDDIFNGNDDASDSLPAEPGADTYNLGTHAPTANDPVGDPQNNYNDSVYYGDRMAAVTATLDGVADDGVAGENDNVGVSVESVTGGAGDDVMVAGAPRVDFRAGAGADTLTGGPGDDELDGDAGGDPISGGDGDDEIEDGDFTTHGHQRSRCRPRATTRIDGGAGNDVSIEVDRGADDVRRRARAGPSSPYDRVIPQDPLPCPRPPSAPGSTISLDGAANDGARGAAEGDNVHSDLEEIYTGAGDDVLTGDGASQVLVSAGRQRHDHRRGRRWSLSGRGRPATTPSPSSTASPTGPTAARGADTVTADLAGQQPERADVLLDCETVGGTPFGPPPSEPSRRTQRRRWSR